jgi:hypothetical protein
MECKALAASCVLQAFLSACSDGTGNSFSKVLLITIFARLLEVAIFVLTAVEVTSLGVGSSSSIQAEAFIRIAR